MNIDLDSVNDLITEQDVDGFIAAGAPADEYETEVEDVFEALAALPIEEANHDSIVAILNRIWKKNFSLDAEELGERQAAFENIADRVLHHFG